MKVLNLKLAIPRYAKDTAREALAVCCAPYGSLSPQVATLALDWVSADTKHERAEAARALVDELYSTECDTPSGIFLDSWGVELITPTSGTRIRLSLASEFTLTVDFGEKGSRARAYAILDVASTKKLHFLATLLDDEGRQTQATHALSMLKAEMEAPSRPPPGGCAGA